MNTNAVTSGTTPAATTSSPVDNNYADNNRIDNNHIDNNHDDGQRYIPQPGKTSYPSETVSLEDRIATEVITVTPDEMKELILLGNFSDDIHYRVEGNLELDKCPAAALPGQLTVTGNFFLTDCIHLKHISGKLTVHDDFCVSGSTDLETLSGKIHIKGDCELKNRPNLKSLSGDLTFDGLLDLTQCRKLSELPEKLTVKRSLILNDCEALSKLPDDLDVGEGLSLRRCAGLRELPGNLSALEHSLDECTNLNERPDPPCAGGDASHASCTSTGFLPDNLSIGGEVSLDGCCILTALPESIIRSGRTENHSTFEIRLADCSNLNERSDPLRAGGDVSFARRTILPDNLSIGGEMSLDGCCILTALPESIIRSDDRQREVHVDDTGLADGLYQRMPNMPPGVRFHYDMGRGNPVHEFESLQEGLDFWGELAATDAATPVLDLRPDQTDHLIEFLGRLTGTADYQNLNTRPVLAQRVMAVMSLLAGNDQFRDDALDRLSHAGTSCDDRVILALDDLETMQLLTSAQTLAFEKHDPTELKALGWQMMILEKIKAIASAHMKTLTEVDEIEVELTFRIELGRFFKFPGSTQNMLFRECALVNDEDIARARVNIEESCTDAALEAFLAQWEPWQKFQRTQAVRPFDELEPMIVDRIDNCSLLNVKTDEMVGLGNGHYSYDGLVRSYLLDGLDPYARTPLDWSKVVKLIEAVSTPAKKED